MLWPLIPSPPYRTPSSFCSLSFLESYVDTYLVRPTGHVESQLKRKCIFRSPSNITQKGEAELGQSEGYGLILSSISSVFSKPTESIGHVWSSLYLPFAHGGETCFMTVSSKKKYMRECVSDVHWTASRQMRVQKGELGQWKQFF
jgi:hypothetical protein